ncbi:MAG: hypothetical protein ACI31M_02015 [Bacilli bacterium]
MQKKNYHLVKDNYYSLRRIRKKVFKTAVIVDLSIGIASAITIFCFNNHVPSKTLDNRNYLNMVDFDQEIIYLDLEDINNQNLANSLEEYRINELESGRTVVNYEQVEREIISLDNAINLSFEQESIMKYCAIYQVDYNIVYNKLAELTNSFTSDEYLNGTIPGIVFKGEPIHFDNKETLLAMAVRCCAQLPSSVGLNDSIKIDTEFESNMTIFQQITTYSSLFGLDRKVVYSIIRAENNFGSNLTDTTNNFGSLKSGDGNSFESFDNLNQGILETCAEIYKFRYRYGITATSEEFLRQIQPYYAPTEGVSEAEAELNENWIINAINAYNEVDSLNVFGDDSLDINMSLDHQFYIDYTAMASEANNINNTY